VGQEECPPPLCAAGGRAHAQADAVLDSLLAQHPTEPEWLALRAQSALEAGDTTTGLAYYDSAVANAGRAGGAMLWRQVVGIATPGEIRAGR
jgi:cytochrome c-type biogenesis protein CcmH/NrfG